MTGTNPYDRKTTALLCIAAMGVQGGRSCLAP
jgi:hypothetical protein